jgi:predicted thioesterase
MIPLVAGLAGEVSLTVTAADTALAVGSGDVEVLATPRVIALCEAATLKAVRNALEDKTTCVGVAVEVRHLAPSVVGADVTASARLVELDGNRLVFEVEAHDAHRLIATGRIVRAVVDRATFPG